MIFECKHYKTFLIFVLVIYNTIKFEVLPIFEENYNLFMKMFVL
jgi:hypothetical protein